MAGKVFLLMSSQRLGSVAAGGKREHDSRHSVASLFQVLVRLNPQQLMALYGELFTEREAIMLAKRLDVACHLLGGKSYEQIRRDVGAAPATISQMHQVLKSAGHGLRAAHQFLSLKESSRVSDRHSLVGKFIQHFRTP